MSLTTIEKKRVSDLFSQYITGKKTNEIEEIFFSKKPDEFNKLLFFMEFRWEDFDWKKWKDIKQFLEFEIYTINFLRNNKTNLLED